GNTTSSPSTGASSRPRSSAASSSGTTSIASAGKPPYLQRSAISAARSPVTTIRSSAGNSGSQSTSQIHDTSRPSAISSFSASTRQHGERRSPARDERPHRLVRAGRILHEQDEHALVADGDPLEAPERGPEPLQSGDDVVERRPERERQGGRAERVVDVVQTG